MLLGAALLLIFTCVSAQDSACSTYTGDGEIGWTWNSLQITRCDTPNTITSIPNVAANTQVLLLTFQPVTSIKQNQFRSNGKLQVIRMADGNISVVERHAFRNLKNLAALSLFQNYISSLPTDIFVDTPNIEEIYLGQNKLHTLQRNLFSNLERLRIVRLFKNEITTIEANAFINLPRLNELSLFGNKLKSLNLNIMKNPQLLSINYLELHSNPWHCDKKLCEVMNVFLNTITLWNKPHEKPRCQSPSELKEKYWLDAFSSCPSALSPSMQASYGDKNKRPIHVP